MKRTYKILSEKYEQVLNETDAAKVGLDVLSKEINLIVFFRWLGDLPEEYSRTLENTLTNYAHSLTDTIAADKGILDDNIPDYEPEVDEYQDAMSRGVTNAFKNYAQIIAKIAPGLTEKEALEAIDNWEG